jgi:hypothetical protein
MAYYKKEKQIHHISEFDSYTKIYQLNKPRSPLTILFCVKNSKDIWLIDVVEYKTHSGIITDTYYITEKQIPSYINFMKKAGFIKITQF